MLVDRDYMLKKTTGPSAPKLFLDTEVVPLVVNVAGRLEVALDQAARRAGVRPSTIVAGIAGVLSLALFGIWRRRGRRMAGVA